jgi:hypothetical protein
VRRIIYLLIYARHFVFRTNFARARFTYTRTFRNTFRARSQRTRNTFRTFRVHVTFTLRAKFVFIINKLYNNNINYIYIH